MRNTDPIQFLRPLPLRRPVKISPLTPPIKHATPMNNRKTVSANTPLLVLVISKAVTKSDIIGSTSIPTPGSNRRRSSSK
jgi:hypothetical protein